ncbi:MAG TPA: sensor histidine kinase [Steroidobacteraceae bacterium]|nr:sensor histidine kinase [Steroidobacteraceae bacterium]
MSAFIAANLDPILVEWVAFARQQQPQANGLDEAALLDHGRLIIQEIAADMRRPEDEAERKAKSEGHSATASSSPIVPSRVHGRERGRQGFGIEEVVGEFRALRATVLRLWTASDRQPSVEDLEDVARFNEAVDQAIAESLNFYLLEVDRTRDLFLGILGHDLRGPLSTIASSVALEKRSGRGDPGAADIVIRSVAQMKALLDDLLEYTRSRLGAGLPIDPAPVHLETFVRNTLKEIEAISSGPVLRFEAQGDTHGEWDARRLHQALSNLVFNALKYGDPDSLQVHVDGRLADTVILTVENTGKPIEPSLLTSIFRPLVRAGNEDVQREWQVAGANLGLGLYVVREIASAHHGTVDVVSNYSVTRFELRLPRSFTAAIK